MAKIIPQFNGWMLVALATLFTVVYQLIAPGMFFDGLTYASIAENYAYSDSFWSMRYTDTLKPDFYEHPPLAFYFQQLFFDGSITEIIYCFLILMVSFLLMKSIFILAGGSKEMDWLPALLFVGTPIVFWSFSNNMLENTLTVFVLFNCWLVLYFLRNNVPAYLYALVGVVTTGCFLVKGPVGLFPLMFLPFHWYFVNDKGDLTKYVKNFSAYFAGIIVMVILIFLNENARIFFDHYFTEQVFASVSGARETSDSRFFILIQLFLELAIMAALTLILYFSGFKNKISGAFYFFLAVGLSGSLPLLISAKQMGFYLVPSLAFFAIAFSLLIHEKISVYIRSKVLTVFLILSFFVFVPTVFKRALYDVRDKEEQNLVMFFSQQLYYTDKTVSISMELADDWALHAYLYRYCKISLDDKNNHLYKILSAHEIPLQDLEIIHANEKFVVYRMK